MQIREISEDPCLDNWINVYLHYHDIIARVVVINTTAEIIAITCRFKNETEYFDIRVRDSGCQIKQGFKEYKLDSYKTITVKSLLQALNEMFYGNNLVLLN